MRSSVGWRPTASQAPREPNNEDILPNQHHTPEPEVEEDEEVVEQKFEESLPAAAS